MKLTESMRDYELEGDLKKEKEIFALGCLSHSTFLFFKCVWGTGAAQLAEGES